MTTMNGARGTTKQLKYAQARVLGQTKRAACRFAGYAVDSRTIQKLEHNLPSLMAQELEMAGVTTAKLAKRLDEGLDATLVKAFRSTVTKQLVGEDGQPVFNAKSGAPVMVKHDEIIHEEFVDHQTRLTAIEIAFRVLDAYPQKNAPAGPAAGEIPPVNIMQVVQQFGHLSNEELTEKMQQMRAGLPLGLDGPGVVNITPDSEKRVARVRQSPPD